MNKIKFTNLFSIIYIIILIGFTTWFLLDTFFIAKRYSVVEPTSNISDSTTIAQAQETAVTTKNSYEDKNIKITISTINKYDTEIYIADIQVSSIEYLQSAFAQSSYGRNITEDTSDMATNNNAILAINGDYYGFRNNSFVLRNGVIYRDNKQTDTTEDLVIYDNGNFEIINENSSDINELENNGAWQIYSFGPGLIENGQLTVDTTTEVSSRSMKSNPRTAIGMIDQLHYLFVVSDGRTQTSAGLSLYQLASIMQEYGCQTAYNLDGGGSSTMVFNGQVINNPTSGNNSGERKISDIIYIGY